MNKKVIEKLRRQKLKKENYVFVFSSKAETILSARNVSRGFSTILENANLPNHFSIHTLRHTFATRLIEKGANPKVISDILGHSSIQITLDIYGHVMPNKKQEAIELLD